MATLIRACSTAGWRLILTLFVFVVAAAAAAASDPNIVALTPPIRARRYPLGRRLWAPAANAVSPSSSLQCVEVVAQLLHPDPSECRGRELAAALDSRLLYTSRFHVSEALASKPH